MILCQLTANGLGWAIIECLGFQDSATQANAVELSRTLHDFEILQEIVYVASTSPDRLHAGTFLPRVAPYVLRVERPWERPDHLVVTTHPQEGAVHYAGEVCEIRWRTSPAWTCSTVTIRLIEGLYKETVKVKGRLIPKHILPVYTIDARAPNTGSYRWHVPAILPALQYAKCTVILNLGDDVKQQLGSISFEDSSFHFRLLPPADPAVAAIARLQLGVRHRPDFSSDAEYGRYVQHALRRAGPNTQVCYTTYCRHIMANDSAHRYTRNMADFSLYGGVVRRPRGSGPWSSHRAGPLRTVPRCDAVCPPRARNVHGRQRPAGVLAGVARSGPGPTA